MVKSVKLIENLPAEFLAVVPNDKVVEIDKFGICFLADQQFLITAELIEKEVA